MKERTIGDEWQGAISGLSVVAAAAAFSALVCVFAQPICTRLGVLDAPDGQRKLHPVITPLAGGLAIGLPTLAALFVTGLTSIFLPLYFAVAIAGVACLLLGLLDDRAHIRPTYRLFLSSLLALVVLEVVPALRVTFLHFSFLNQHL